jgi:hypothetical protein
MILPHGSHSRLDVRVHFYFAIASREHLLPNKGKIFVKRSQPRRALRTLANLDWLQPKRVPFEGDLINGIPLNAQGSSEFDRHGDLAVTELANYLRLNHEPHLQS